MVRSNMSGLLKTTTIKKESIMRKNKKQEFKTIEDMPTKFRNKHFAKLLAININGVREDAWKGTLSKKHKCRKHGKIKHVWVTKVVGPSIEKVTIIDLSSIQEDDSYTNGNFSYDCNSTVTPVIEDLKDFVTLAKKELVPKYAVFDRPRLGFTTGKSLTSIFNDIAAQGKQSS